MGDGLILGVISLVGLAIAVVALAASRYRVAGPNEAFIITGRKRGGELPTSTETALVKHDAAGQKVIIGASTFVWPVVQKLHVLDLSSRRISVGITGAVSAQGIKCDLEGVAIVKVGGTQHQIRAAAQRFLDQQEGIEVFTKEVLAGSLRAIVGRLTVDEIIKDRAAFAAAVAEEAETSLTNQGLSLDTFQLQDIRAEGDYLEDLGRPEAARVEMEAAIAEARARQTAEQERLLAEEQIAVATRALVLKQAEIRAETDAAEAEALAAGPLAQAARDQEVIGAQEQVAERKAALTERELDTQIRKPADADRYRVEQEAEAHKTATLRNAEAERSRREALAIAKQREAEAEAAAILAKGQAEAKARKENAAAYEREGEAEAAAILAKGQAEAKARKENAAAFAHYNEAATIELLTDILPELVRAAAEPIGSINDLTVISTDGASKIVSDVSQNLEQGLAIGSSLTGIDLKGLLSQIGREKPDETPTLDDEKSNVSVDSDSDVSDR